MNLYIVAKDSRLLRWVRVVDAAGEFSVVRFNQLHPAGEKIRRDVGAIVLIDWKSAEVAEGIGELNSEMFRNVRSRFFVCVNDMQLLFPADAEAIRFAVLQTGVGGVFSQLQELTVLMPVFVRYAQQHNQNKYDPFNSAWDSLPWKKHAVKSEYR
ncbi:MAG: hypothetical protein LBT09_01615 [Planctomycetaceae bacterium]|jgi:hypothetical protein|nr:hypothetical protein [Planctomycetaceae bacterium]